MMQYVRGILVPVKELYRCDYCNDLLGIKPHPMLPELPKQDHCTCQVAVDYKPRKVD